MHSPTGLPVDPLSCARLLQEEREADFAANLLNMAAGIASVEEIFAWTGREGAPPEVLLAASRRGGQDDRVKSYAGRFFRSDPLVERDGIDGFFVRVVTADEIGFAEYRQICFARPLFDHKISFVRRANDRSIVLNFYLREGHADPDAMLAALTTLATVAIAGLHNRIVARDTGIDSAAQRMANRLAARFDQLSAMEAKVLARFALAMTPARIAADLSVQPTTVKTYRARALAKCGCREIGEILAQLAG